VKESTIMWGWKKKVGWGWEGGRGKRNPSPWFYKGKSPFNQSKSVVLSKTKTYDF